MNEKHTVSVVDEASSDGPGHSRRGLLECMAWAGLGVIWTVSGGVPQSRLIGSANAAQHGLGQDWF